MDQSLARRIKVAQVLLAVPPLLIILQVLRFQVFPTEERKELYDSPYPLNQHVETPRGRILDRNGNLLAGNKSQYRMYVDNCQYYLYLESFADDGTRQSSLSDVLAAVVAETGAEIDIAPVVQFLREMDKNLQANYGSSLSTCTVMAGINAPEGKTAQAIPFWLTEDQNQKLRVAMGLSADANGDRHPANPLLSNIRTEAWYFRDYPEGTLASEVIGYSRTWGEGAGNRQSGVIRYYKEIGDWGVERFYNDIIQGTREDVTWTVVPMEINRNLDRAHPPADLVLTLDRDIQAEAERLLKKAIEGSEAARGSVLVLDPKTGEILAMADYPPVDLDNPDSFSDIFHEKGKMPMDPNGQVVSLNLAAPYEPGSTFKVLTMAAALDAGIIAPDTTFIDEGGIEIGGYLIHNWEYRRFGLQDMTGCLRYSINTCLAWVAKSMGPSVFYNYLDKFRIGRLTGVDLSPEISGTLRVPGDKYWTDSTLATNAYGQGVSVTTLQLATAIAAVANDGVMMTPHIVRRIIAPDGTIQEVAPVPLGQPISAETAHTLSEMLANSLEVEGSRALVNGYRVAGKTGTADIPPYINDKTIASFVGWGPEDNPRMLVYIRIDEPTQEGDQHYGSITAAPVFSQLAARIFAILGIPADPDLLKPVQP